MAFRCTVTNYPGDNHSHGGAGDWYEFGGGGVLGVHFGDPKKDSQYYSPNNWDVLSADQPPGPQTEVPVWGFKF